MRKEIIAGLLMVACLGTSFAVSAASQVTRGATEDVKWETDTIDKDITIFTNPTGSDRTAWVFVHVDDKGDKNNFDLGIFLEGCGGNNHIHVHRGESIQCRVREGHKLQAESATDCEETGTLQQIRI